MDNKSMAAELLGSRTRAVLLNELLINKAKGSVRSLSKRAGIAYFPISHELERLVRLGLVKRHRIAAAAYHEVDWSHPVTPCLAELLKRCAFHRKVTRRETRDKRDIQATLAASLRSAGRPVKISANMPLENALVSAVRLSHSDSTMLQVLPLFIFNVAKFLDWKAVQVEAQRQDVRQSLGMLVDLAGKLFHRPDLQEHAVKFRDHRRTKLVPYLVKESQSGKTWPKKNLSALVKRWGFLLDRGRIIPKKGGLPWR